MTEPTEPARLDPEQEDSLHTIYTEIIERLNRIIYKSETLTNKPEIVVAPAFVTSLIGLKTWAADTEVEHDTGFLTRLYHEAPPVGAQVRNRLRTIRSSIAGFEAALSSGDRTGRVDSLPQYLIDYSSRIFDAVNSLRELTEDVLEYREESFGTSLSSTVRLVLRKRDDPSHKAKMQTQELDVREAGDLAYSDEESGERRRSHPFRRLKAPSMSRDTQAEGGGASEAKASSKIQSSYEAQSQFPPISKDQIRLATLFPGDWNEEIRFSVKVVNLDRLKTYRYEAASYAWDSQRQDVKIYMASHYHKGVRDSQEQTLFLSPHAANLLRRVRYKEVAVMIWIDVLCMDLINDEEKYAQSQNYAPIFTHAERVNLWIGEDDNISDVSFDWLRRLLKCEVLNDLDLHRGSVRRWEEFLQFMNLAVFRRRWIVLELILAKQITILYYTQRLPWDDFVDAVTLWQRAKLSNVRLASHLYDRVLGSRNALCPEDQKTSAERLIHARRYLNQKRAAAEDVSAEELILSFSWTENRRTHDAVYAFIGLAWGSAKSAFEDWPPLLSMGSPLINYSLSDRTVLMRFVARCIRLSGSLDIILRPWAPEKTVWPLPSWIQKAVARQHQSVRVRFVGQPGQRKQFYNASGGAYPSYQFSDINSSQYALTKPKGLRRAEVLAVLAELDLVSHRHFLFVDGIRIGAVTSASPRISQGVIPRECLRLGLPEGKPLPASKNDGTFLSVMFDNVAHTLVADRTIQGDPVPKWYVQVIRNCLNDSAEKDLDTARYDGAPTAIAEVLSRVQNVTWNRKLIRVDDKAIGLAPADTKENDQVCVLFGCSVPVILRKHREKPPSYRVIGECFLHGYMDGEAIASGVNSSQFMLV